MRAHAMNAMKPTATRRPRGTGIIEVMLVLVTMTMVIGAAISVLKGTLDAWRVADTQSHLQESGRRMLDAILSDLRRSGLTTTGGANYPSIWERPLGPESTPRGSLIATMNYADESLVDEAYAWSGNGDRIARNAARAADEIVFQVPRDQDGDGTPLDANGDLEWGPELLSYRVIEDAGGNPWLWRITELNGAVIDRQRIGGSLASLTFDVVFNDRTLRFGEVAVVLYLQDVNARGQLLTATVEGSVGLRNTREL